MNIDNTLYQGRPNDKRIPKEERTAGQKKGYEPPITVTIITRTPRAIPRKKPEADKQS